MAKRNLSTQEKIQKAKNKRRMNTAVKIGIPVGGLLIIIVMVFALYDSIVWKWLPMRDYDQYKNVGSGYSRPLNAIPESDNNTYTLAYYYEHYWHVIDDDAVLKANRENFIVYKKEEEWLENDYKQLFIMRNNGCMAHIPLSKITLIKADCFKDYEKLMTMEEFEDYCFNERQFNSVYIYYGNLSDVTATAED